jgi:uncharacterized Zn finger protein (UPF0148 family)
MNEPSIPPHHYQAYIENGQVFYRSKKALPFADGDNIAFNDNCRLCGFPLGKSKTGPMLRCSNCGATWKLPTPLQKLKWEYEELQRSFESSQKTSNDLADRLAKAEARTEKAIKYLNERGSVIAANNNLIQCIFDRVVKILKGEEGS